MLLSQMFEDVKKQWPKDIIIDDCVLYSDGGLLCEWLNSMFWKMEEICGYGEWGKLMNWGVVCGLDKYIRSLNAPYPREISIDCMDVHYAIEKINESIDNTESIYHHERYKHENDLHTLIKQLVVRMV